MKGRLPSLPGRSGTMMGKRCRKSTSSLHWIEYQRDWTVSCIFLCFLVAAFWLLYSLHGRSLYCDSTWKSAACLCLDTQHHGSLESSVEDLHIKASHQPLATNDIRITPMSLRYGSINNSGSTPCPASTPPRTDNNQRAFLVLLGLS